MKKKLILFTETMTILGGMERVVAFLANELSLDYDVTVLTVYSHSCEYFDIKFKIDSLDIDIAPTSYLKKFQRYLLIIMKLRKHLKENSDVRYFIANSTALCSSTILANSTLKNNIKFIAFEHCTFLYPGKFWQLIRKYTFKYFYKVIALTNDTYENYKKLGYSTVCIPNPLIITVGKQSNLKNKKLISIGRLVHDKGYDLLLSAWKEVITIHPDWSLEIIGNGREREKLLELSKKLNIMSHVTFLGEITNVQEVYTRASGYILSSRHEGFGLVMIEAMAHGLPCISFDCNSGPRDIITEGKNGFLAKPNSIEALAEKIIYYIALSQEDKKNMSMNAQITSMNYNPFLIIKQWREKVLND